MTKTIRNGITLKEFRAAEVTKANNATYLGAWNTREFFYVVFAYPNGARMRITYWKTAEQVLACVRDYYGCYHCIGNNIKSMEAVNELIASFDWRMYDAKKATHGTIKTATQPTAEDMKDIIEHLNKIKEHDNSD